jgi:hypothetical protein
MEAMQKQIESFVQTLNQELSERAAHRPREGANSLMPVIQINSLTTRTEPKRPEGKRRVR